MIEQKHFRMPSEEKIHRGRLTIEALQKEIYLFGYKFVGKEPFRRYPSWRTEYGDYKGMLRAARGLLDEGIRAEVDASGFGGEAGSQFIVAAHAVRKGNIDILTLIDKAAANIAAREQRTKGVSEEEMNQIYEEAEQSGADIDEVWKKKVIPRLPRDVTQIRSSIWSKVFPQPD